MHTVTCVRTLSIGPRRHGPRLCVFRLCVAKVALRRPRSRERRCPVAASRCHRTKSALLATFQGGRAAKSSWCRKKGLHPARPTGGRAGTAMAHSSRAPTPARAPKHRSLADFKPSGTRQTSDCPETAVTRQTTRDHDPPHDEPTAELSPCELPLIEPCVMMLDNLHTGLTIDTLN